MLNVGFLVIDGQWLRVGKRCQTEQIVIFQKERHNLEMLFSAKTYLAYQLSLLQLTKVNWKTRKTAVEN